MRLKYTPHHKRQWFIDQTLPWCQDQTKFFLSLTMVPMHDHSGVNLCCVLVGSIQRTGMHCASWMHHLTSESTHSLVFCILSDLNPFSTYSIWILSNLSVNVFMCSAEHLKVTEVLCRGHRQSLCFFVCVFQLSCCGKGQGTSFLTHFTDTLGLTDLCPTSGTTVVSAIIHLNSFMHKQQIFKVKQTVLNFLII